MIQRGVTFRASKIPSPAVRTGTGLGENSLDYVIIFQCPALRIRPERRISHECVPLFGSYELRLARAALALICRAVSTHAGSEHRELSLNKI